MAAKSLDSHYRTDRSQDDTKNGGEHGNVDLALVHEMEYGDQVVIEDALEVQKRMLVRVPPEDCAEEGGAGSDDHFVGLYLVVVTHESHVEEVFLLSDVIE